MIRKSKSKKIFSISLVATLLIIGLALLAYSIWQIMPRYVATNDPHPTIEKKVITKSIDRPNETSPKDACDTYKVDAPYPERIKIPAISASGCIERVGLDEKGAIAVPSNIHTAGWYVDSVLPGQPGLSVIDGHISGYYNTDGIFQKLYKLREGDEFTVTLGDGKILHYTVTGIQAVPVANAIKALMSRDPTIKSQLNLITCGGKYDQKTKQYERRVIVTSKLERVDP